jgi:glycogen phosphorylase
MGFQIQPLREFLVRPAIPAALSRMPELAYNIVWSWEPAIRTLFRRLDPGAWKDSFYNPVVMLGRVSQSTLERAAADPRYLNQYHLACQRYDASVKQSVESPGGKVVAYFSAEYGLTECVPIYSGGLGVLAGDHLKSCSDLGVQLVGVGLLYQHGYFRQLLNADGWQQERTPVTDFYTLPIQPACSRDNQELRVSVDMPSGPVQIKIWVLLVGRVRLVLLDTNIPENARLEDRMITDQLYGGDNDTRIRQEIVLGIGGLRALAALGIEPTVYHMNEGHSAFLALERICVLMRDHKLSFEEALEAARSNNVFTTHTPVPAGIDLFDPGLVYHYFERYCGTSEISFEKLMALGRKNADDRSERLSMAILALNTSSYRNAVSKLHRDISQLMWQSLWPELPTWEIPITSVTNGVHLQSWLNGDLADLFDQYLPPGWRDWTEDASIWKMVAEIPDEEVAEAHRRRKRRLIAFIRERQVESAQRRKAAASEVKNASEVLDPNALTIGFARRFATYKRATLLFRDLARLKKILLDKERPVQIVIAGKAHPKDAPGKEFIRQIAQYARDPELWKHVVFLEDYEMKVAREMIQGVDIWLNTPRRGEEACGTSGMKAAMNGVLNLSILDGWFDEAYEVSGGWAIGDREPYNDDQDGLHASAIYYLLENEIVPMFYERRTMGTSEWTRRSKQSIMGIIPGFDARRMVHQYDTELYTPAHKAAKAIEKDDFRPARDRAAWNRQILSVWNNVRFLETGPIPVGPLTSGKPLSISTRVDLGGLKPEDVRVEVVWGQVGTNGTLVDTEAAVLTNTGTNGTVATYSRELIPQQTGRLGYALRISPNHFDNPLTRPVPSLIKWG